MRNRHALAVTVLAGLALLLIMIMAKPPPARAQQPAPAQPRQFGADYDGLNAAQRALVDDIYRRIDDILGRTLDPKDAYKKTPLSLRTTFDAVTNALLNSALTDRETGEPLGRPIDLIDHLEAVAGQAKGRPGDFGRYFASALQVRVRAGETAVLYLGWTKEDGAWRIFSFKVIEP